MKLYETYNSILVSEFWKKLEEELILDEGSENLNTLISKANELVFKKFKINPKERKYCIVGSARLYLYPALRDAFGLDSNIGDLDIVIPNKVDWENAGLLKEWNENGIYKPTSDGSIEVFNVWDPSRAGGSYADVSVRSTSDIIKDATLINGYYFMSLYDIVDYKMSMNRDKEKDIVRLIVNYQKSGLNNRKALLRKMVKIIGMDNTKSFLGKVKN